jgi:hypothetical protein
MADKIKVWFDAEADSLEVRFSGTAGHEKSCRQTGKCQAIFRSLVTRPTSTHSTMKIFPS